MHQTKKGNQWYFGMKAHIGVDADSGLVHTVTTTAANEADVEQVQDLLHGKEEVVHADAGYTGAQTRVEKEGLRWEIAAKRGRIKAMKDGRDKRGDREERKAQGQHPRPGRASVPGDQASVRLDEGALQRLGEEYRAPDHAVRAVKSVDGAKTADGDEGTVASAICEMTRNEGQYRCVQTKIGGSDAQVKNPKQKFVSVASFD